MKYITVEKSSKSQPKKLHLSMRFGLLLILVSFSLQIESIVYFCCLSSAISINLNWYFRSDLDNSKSRKACFIWESGESGDMYM